MGGVMEQLLVEGVHIGAAVVLMVSVGLLVWWITRPRF